MRFRPATRDDLDAVLELVHACDVADVGAADTTREDLLVDWRRAGYDAWLAEEGGRIAAYAALWERHPGRAYQDGYVHPDFRGRGLGPELVRVAEERARERGCELLSAFAVAAVPDAGRIFERAGFSLTRHLLRMEIELEHSPPAPVPVPGVSIRAFRAGDERAIWDTVNEAFAEEYGFSPERFEAWRRDAVERDDFDPALWFLAVAEDDVLGISICYRSDDVGWIQSLGVRPGARRRGLGLALLVAAFRAFDGRGLRTASLAVDAANPTEAKRLYERAGMRETFRIDRYEKRLATL